MTSWNVSYASVTGVSHKQSKLPCQDSAKTCLSKDGKWISCVVSDGAGSAKHSQIASKLLTKTLSVKLIDLSEKIASNGWEYAYKKFIVDAIESVRDDLKKQAKSEDLRDYHCTLIATLIGEKEGLSIHLGDGAIFGGSITPTEKNKVTLSKNTFISLPENGQYANETFFVTEKDWQNHLRIKKIEGLDWIVTATDGGTALAMINDKEAKPGFIKPVIHQLTIESSEKNRNKLLKTILSDTQANKLTSDDKTLAIIYRSGLLNKETEIEMDEAAQKITSYLPPPSMLKRKVEEKKALYVQNNLQDEKESSKLTIFLCVFIIFELILVFWLYFDPATVINLINRVIHAASSFY